MTFLGYDANEILVRDAVLFACFWVGCWCGRRADDR